METLVQDFASKLANETGETTDDGEASRLMKAAWEAMLVDGMDGAIGTAGAGASGTHADPDEAAAPSSTNDFQTKIKQTMEKRKESTAEPGGSTPVRPLPHPDLTQTH